jgi:hypothetical protein
VKIVLTLLVRDEADVLETLLAHHLHASVDFIIAVDHDSRDASAEIHESCAATGSYGGLGSKARCARRSGARASPGSRRPSTAPTG